MQSQRKTWLGALGRGSDLARGSWLAARYAQARRLDSGPHLTTPYLWRESRKSKICAAYVR